MADESEKVSTLCAIRDLVLAIGSGLAGAVAIVELFRATVPPEYLQYEWFEDLQSLIEIVAGLTVGGLVYALALHFHAKRDGVQDVNNERVGEV